MPCAFTAALALAGATATASASVTILEPVVIRQVVAAKADARSAMNRFYRQLTAVRVPAGETAAGKPEAALIVEFE